MRWFAKKQCNHTVITKYLRYFACSAEKLVLKSKANKKQWPRKRFTRAGQTFESNGTVSHYGVDPSDTSRDQGPMRFDIDVNKILNWDFDFIDGTS